jgi:uncharacterized membrane protein YdjX (TVP38/TMEM64 family)
MGTNHSVEIKPTSGISSNYLLTLLKVSKAIVLFTAVFIFYLVRFTTIACMERLINSETYKRLVIVSLRRLSPIISGQARLVAKVSLGFVTLIIVWVFRHPLLELSVLVSDRTAVIAYLEQFGLWGPALLMILLWLQVIVAAIPGHALMVGGAYVYGFSTSFLISLVSTVGASQCAFLLARWAGRPVVVRLAPAHILDKWNKAAEQKGAVFFFFSFMLPIFPSDVMNFVAGLSSLPHRQFMAVNFLGRLPGVVLMTTIGAYGLELPLETWIAIGLASAVMFLAWWYFIAREKPV